MNSEAWGLSAAGMAGSSEEEAILKMAWGAVTERVRKCTGETEREVGKKQWRGERAHLDLCGALRPGHLARCHLQHCTPQGPDVCCHTVPLLANDLGRLRW